MGKIANSFITRAAPATAEEPAGHAGDGSSCTAKGRQRGHRRRWEGS